MCHYTLFKAIQLILIKCIIKISANEVNLVNLPIGFDIIYLINLYSSDIFIIICTNCSIQNNKIYFLLKCT